MPMHCRTATIPVATEHGMEYAHAIVCSRTAARRCVVCGTTRAIKLCDFPLTGPKAGQTCDRPVCVTHATHEDPDTDYCPRHARMLAERKD